MSDFSEKFKEPFEEQLSRQLELLDTAVEDFNAQKPVIEGWPARKKRLKSGVIMSMERWKAKMRHMARPMDWKPFKRQKKRLIRSSIFWYQRRGFAAKSGVALLRLFNILRILLILSTSIAAIFLLGYGIVKLFTLIGGV
jgi:hypothetical protein